jgi:cardiolipin hydrolase
MDETELREILARTLDDGRLSRGERKALRAVAEEGTKRERRTLRRVAFDLAREAAPDPRSEALVTWLEEVLGALRPERTAGTMLEVEISPGDACRQRITGLIDAATETVDVCVYTITDDRISRRLLAAHARGVRVRIVTDDDKSDDLGSDIERIRTAGVPVRFDDSPHQMHHKFAIFDGRTALTGSYNWTRTAAEHNQENLVVSDDPRLVRVLDEEFDRLWARFR